MQPIEPLKTWLDAVDASGADEESAHFALNNVDEIYYSIEGTTPTVEFQHNQIWDPATNAPKSDTWYVIETQSAAGVYSLSVRTGYGRFVATAGNPVTVKARRLVSDDAAL